jgi:hypothetical protein
VSRLETVAPEIVKFIWVKAADASALATTRPKELKVTLLLADGTNVAETVVAPSRAGLLCIVAPASVETVHPVSVLITNRTRLLRLTASARASCSPWCIDSDMDFNSQFLRSVLNDGVAIIKRIPQIETVMISSMSVTPD